MKPDWDKLGSTYEDSSSVLIADVDCTVEKDLCSDYDVSGYPTIKYFTGETGKEGASYSGGRDYDALDAFVTESLQIACSLEERDGCNEKENKFIETMKEKGADAIAKQIERLEGMKGKKMKPALAGWLKTRLRLLNEMAGEGGAKEEL